MRSWEWKGLYNFFQSGCLVRKKTGKIFSMSEKSNFKFKSRKSEVWRKEQENESYFERWWTWQKYQDNLIFLENAVIMFGQLVNVFFCVWISGTELIVNPFTLKISSVILPTVCNTIWRIWYWINLSNNHLIDIFLYSHHICRVWYWRCEGELSFGHLWEFKD